MRSRTRVIGDQESTIYRAHRRSPLRGKEHKHSRVRSSHARYYRRHHSQEAPDLTRPISRRARRREDSARTPRHKMAEPALFISP